MASTSRQGSTSPFQPAIGFPGFSSPSSQEEDDTKGNKIIPRIKKVKFAPEAGCSQGGASTPVPLKKRYRGLTSFSSSSEEDIKAYKIDTRKHKTNKKAEKQTLYCICRSNQVSTFMIGCDKCNEWFHGKCVGLKAKDATSIDKWYCLACIQIYDLNIVYYKNETEKKSKKKGKGMKSKKQGN